MDRIGHFGLKEMSMAILDTYARQAGFIRLKIWLVVLICTSL